MWKMTTQRKYQKRTWNTGTLFRTVIDNEDKEELNKINYTTTY